MIPPAWEHVWICHLANGHLQATGRDVRGRKQYLYHPSYREFRSLTNFDCLLLFGEALPHIRATMSKHLREPGLPMHKVLAAVVRLLDQTCIRGNNEYARANDRFGLTTFRDDHADIKGNTIRFRFHGENGREGEVNFHDPQLARVVKRCQDLPGEELFQFETEIGEYRSIGSSEVNGYLREISGEDLTAKDFRTWHGTMHAMRLLNATGRPASEKQGQKQIANAVKETASKLGNRPSTCRRYYIHPGVFESYLKGSLLADMEQARAGRYRSRQEAAVLSLIKRYRHPPEPVRGGARSSPVTFEGMLAPPSAYRAKLVV